MSKTESNGRRQRLTKCQIVFHFGCFIDFFYLSWRNLMNTQHPDLIDCLRLCAIGISFKSHFCRSFWIVEYGIQISIWKVVFFFVRTGSFCCDFHQYCVFCHGFSGFVHFFCITIDFESSRTLILSQQITISANSIYWMPKNSHKFIKSVRLCFLVHLLSGFFACWRFTTIPKKMPKVTRTHEINKQSEERK